jgi:hypothetical protein
MPEKFLLPIMQIRGTRALLKKSDHWGKKSCGGRPPKSAGLLIFSKKGDVNCTSYVPRSL